MNDLLHGLPFVEGMSVDQLAILASCASERSFPEGEYMTRVGQPATELFLIRQGQVTVETPVADHGRLQLETLHGGDVLGWSWLVEPYQWQFDSRTLSPVEAVVLDGTCLREHCRRDHLLGYELLLRVARVIEQRLHATRLQLLDIYQPRGS